MKFCFDARLEHEGVTIWRTIARRGDVHLGFLVDGFMPITLHPSFLSACRAAEGLPRPVPTTPDPGLVSYRGMI